MLTFLKRLFCRHRRRNWLYNFHGDQIIANGYNRTGYSCCDCGKFLLGKELVTREQFVAACKHEFALDRHCPGNGGERWTDTCLKCYFTIDR